MRAKDAESTWALIIGIDTYDSNAIRDLAGASLDAVAVVEWLRKIGVADDHIILHAAPKPASHPAVTALGLPVQGCTEPDIWGSFKALDKTQGSKLFVFMMGHGLYEPTGGRVFLTREATPEEPQNLGIDWYCAYLRGLKYSTQYVFLDGCLNLPYANNVRPRFEPGRQIIALNPRDDVAQMFCSGASMGQLALELEGRGAFTSTLMRAVDPDHLDPLGVVVDPTDGTMRLDMSKIVTAIVRPTFDRLKLDQQPYFRPQGDTPSPDLWSLADLVPPEVAKLSVRVEPPTGASGVKRIVLSSFDPDFRVRYPSNAALEAPASIATTLPVGVEVEASCAPKTGWSSSPSAPQSVTIEKDTELVFTMRGEPENAGVPLGMVTREATIEYLGPDGSRLHDVSEDVAQRIMTAVEEHQGDLALDDALDLDVNVEPALVSPTNRPSNPFTDALSYLGTVHSGGDIGIHLNDVGAVITSMPESAHLLAPFGEALLGLLSKHAFNEGLLSPSEPTEARLRIRPSIQPTSGLRLPALEDVLAELGWDTDPADLTSLIGHLAASTGLLIRVTKESARRLAGFLHEAPVLTVGDVALTLDEVAAEPFVPLDGGPWTLTLSLPWGVWNRRIAITDGQRSEVTLPRSVGVSPLRVRALDVRRPLEQVDPHESLPGWTVLTAGDTVLLTTAGRDRATRVRFTSGPPPVPWRGVLWHSPDAVGPPKRLRVETKRCVLETSLVASGPVALHLAPPYRAEPLSVVPSAHWDALVASGQLESLTSEQVVSLTHEKWSDPILGVAGAYACFAQGQDELLEVVLNNLDNLPWDLPDVTFLRAALDWRRGRREQFTRSRLHMFQDQDRLPLFRWGLEIGIAGAAHYNVDPLVANLEALALRAIPSSTWLLWKGQ